MTRAALALMLLAVLTGCNLYQDITPIPPQCGIDYNPPCTKG